MSLLLALLTQAVAARRQHFVGYEFEMLLAVAEHALELFSGDSLGLPDAFGGIFLNPVDALGSIGLDLGNALGCRGFGEMHALVGAAFAFAQRCYLAFKPDMS